MTATEGRLTPEREAGTRERIEMYARFRDVGLIPFTASECSDLLVAAQELLNELNAVQRERDQRAPRTVYLLETHADYDGDTAIAIHATRGSAEAAAVPRDGDFWQRRDGFWIATRDSLNEWHITEWEVAGA